MRMKHVGVVVDDLPAAIAFFVELGLELEGETSVSGPWVDRVVGLDDVRSEIAMLRTPDGHSRLELTRFHSPTADHVAPADPDTSADPAIHAAEAGADAPANAPGIRHLTFTVEDIDDVLTRLQTHGARLVGELAQYEDRYRLCYVRGPAGIIVELTEALT